MQQMKNYTTFVTEKGDLVIVLPLVEDAEPLNSKVLYDGKEHALLYRTPNEVIILDYLNEVAQAIMKQAGQVLIFEVDLNQQDIIRDYFSSVILTEELPFFELEKNYENKESN